MNGIRSLHTEMDRLVTEFVLPIQTTRVIDSKAGDSLCEVVDQICRALKGEQMLSRKLLQNMHGTIKVLQNEAPYSKHPDELLRVADDLSYSFDLILLGETRDDRAPGVPRKI